MLFRFREEVVSVLVVDMLENGVIKCRVPVRLLFQNKVVKKMSILQWLFRVPAIRFWRLVGRCRWQTLDMSEVC